MIQIILVTAIAVLTSTSGVFFLAQFGRVESRVLKGSAFVGSLFVLGVVVIAARDYSAKQKAAATCGFAPAWGGRGPHPPLSDPAC